MRDYIKDFIDAKSVEKGSAINTLQSYKSDLEQLKDFLYPKKIEDMQLKDIEKYLIGLNKEGKVAKTICRKISCIREFCKFLQSEDIIRQNPVSKLCLPKVGKPLPWFLTPKEISKMCSIASKSENLSLYRAGIMINLMYSSGLRVSELVSLKEGDINYDLHQIQVYGKGDKERIVPISKDVLSDVLNYLEYRSKFVKNKKNIYLFPSLTSLCGHITRDGFYKALKKIAVLAGISPSKVHPHILRHSFATTLINNDVDLRSIQKMLGHENIITTEIYTHISTDKLSNEVQKNHPLSQIKLNKLKE